MIAARPGQQGEARDPLARSGGGLAPLRAAAVARHEGKTRRPARELLGQASLVGAAQVIGGRAMTRGPGPVFLTGMMADSPKALLSVLPLQGVRAQGRGWRASAAGARLRVSP